MNYVFKKNLVGKYFRLQNLDMVYHLNMIHFWKKPLDPVLAFKMINPAFILVDFVKKETNRSFHCLGFGAHTFFGFPPTNAANKKINVFILDELVGDFSFTGFHIMVKEYEKVFAHLISCNFIDSKDNSFLLNQLD